MAVTAQTKGSVIIMKRVLGIMILVLCGSVAVGAEASSIHMALACAATASGTNYIASRNAIVDLGSNSVPQLLHIAASTNEPWQIRAMAGIVAERIQRVNDINAMVERDWQADPEYNTEWNLLRGGPEIPLTGLVLKRYREAGLWHFYLEQVWKDASESSKNVIMREDTWRAGARMACKESPTYDLMLMVVAERVRNDIGFKQYERWGEFNFLLESTTNTALPILLELLPVAPVEQRDLKLLKVVCAIAQPEDAPLIEKHFRDKGQEIPEALHAPLKALKDRLRKKTDAR